MSQESSTVAVQRAAAALAAGRLIVVLDEEDRENEADLVGAAELVTDEQIAFIVRHTAGIICVPMTPARCKSLRLPQMVTHNRDTHGTAFTVSVDHVDTSTGVSAADRATTVRALAHPGTHDDDLRRPGHVFPLQARQGGTLVRAGHTEAAVDLLQIAGLRHVGVISELVGENGAMMRGKQALEFALQYDLPVVRVEDVVRYRRRTERLVRAVASASMPTVFGDFRAVAYKNSVDGGEHLALVMGDVASASRELRGTLTRVHSECLTGDILGSLRCDCGAQLETALRLIAEEKCGVLVYLRGHEGRGIGLAHKMTAYALQEQGLDTVDANIAQGLPVDARSYGVGAQILEDLGVSRLRLLTNNVLKANGLAGYGLSIVEQVALNTATTPHNVRYLRTKRDRLGHELQIGNGGAVL
jgi:3,4-dihydroxy 2-butanone 4-phosphate synthase/GTP cyclohydrolase II